MSTLAIIQARTGSERLPGKVLEEIAGTPMVEHVVNRVKSAEMVDKVCVAIPDGGKDDPLAAHLAGLEDITVYRGSEDDVLARFFWAAQTVPDGNPIVRITADDPFKDPKLIDYAVQGFLAAWAEPDERLPEPESSPQYLHLGGYSWPLGLDVEVFTRQILTIAHKSAVKPEEREHVTAYMARVTHPWQLKNPFDHGSDQLRWTVDEPKDLAFARQVYDELGAEFGYEDMIRAGY